MRFSILAVTGLSLALSACTLPRAEVVARLSQSPTVDGGVYTSGGGLTVAADMRESDGLTMVCGVWAISRQQSALTKLAEHQVLNSGSVYRGRERVVSGLLFMRRVDPAPSYAGQEANCYRTDRPWKDPANTGPVRIFLPRQPVEEISDSPFGGGFVMFLPKGPGAGDS